jgi:hypothetical protein
MNRHNDRTPGFDPRVADWLETDPGAAPEVLLEAVLAAFPSIPQRRTTRLMGRLPTMNRFTYFAAAATAAIALVAVAGGGLLKPTPPTVVASASPSTSIPPSPSPSPSPSALTITRLGHNGLIAAVHEGALVLIDPATAKVTKILVPRPNDENNPYAVSDISWAPDGRRLAYVSHDGPIFVIDVATVVSQQILSCGIEADGCSIAWSPDGERIAVTVRFQLQLIDPDGGNRQVLNSFAGSAMQPTWSPDGLRIAVVVNDAGSDRRQLVVVDRDGSSVRTVLGPLAMLGVFDPAWSPDGTSIAYLGSTDHRTCTGRSSASCQDDWQLHAMVLNLATSTARDAGLAGVCFCLGFMPGLTWAPDGTRLALVIPSDGPRDWGLEIMTVANGGRTPVTDAWGPVGWQPVP